MDTRLEFIKIISENNDILEEYFEEDGGLFKKKKKKIMRSSAMEALNSTQEAIRKYIKYDQEEERFYVGNLKFGFTYDPVNHDTILIYDTPTEYDENFQFISFELDRIFPEPLEGDWLVTTYKIVVSDDTFMLYNHNENFKFDILNTILDKPIADMNLEEATILQYVLSWIVICTEFDLSDMKDKRTFVEVLLKHKYDDVNFYNEYDFHKALLEVTKA